jgi:hypothetical protein
MNAKYQFQTLEANINPYPIHDNFMDAWKDMYKYVKGLLDKGQMSIQMLETSIWINNLPGVKLPTMFYDARDKAIKEGWKQPTA